MNVSANPLLEFDGPAPFDRIRPEHVTPAVAQLLADAKAAVDECARADAPVSWDAVVAPLEDALDRLDRAWSAVAHLNAVLDTPELRAQYNASLPLLTAFWAELAQNDALHARYKALAALPAFAHWPAARRRVVENELRDFRLGGAELAPAARERFKAIRQRLSQASTRFAENVLDASNAFALYLEDADRLAGVPADSVQMFREAAQADGREGYKIALQAPSYTAIIEYADDRGLREQLYRAWNTRAAEFGDPRWNNGPLMAEILALRDEQAHLLGYANYAELSLVPKMADTPADVLHFLRDLNRRARPYAQKDVDDARAFAATGLGIADLQPWDFSYAAEKLREARYSYSEQELKQYFTEPRVLAGLFRLIESLFGVQIRRQEVPVWHPDVSAWRIEDLRGGLVGEFYLDRYARNGKRAGAWQAGARSRRGSRASLKTPAAFLTCNFSRPAGGKPALFRHREVVTLFHEFGHGLHYMLTRVDEPPVAGTNGVEWDAIELPSQFMENFTWQWDVLQQLTAHVDTGEPLPRTLYDRMIAARNFQSGSLTARQLEFGLYDMLLHSGPAPHSLESIDAALAQARKEAAVLPVPEYNRFAHAFSHIYAGAYAAGYYSYKWAEVLSADAFAAFEESGVLNPATGQRFREEILAVGGSRPAMESFVAFRGRKPTIDALLRQHGMTG